MRLAKECLQQAEYHDPGWLPEEQVDRMTAAQQRRHWNRHYDFQAISQAALDLHDALSTLRP
jgi:hypothetical protein